MCSAVTVECCVLYPCCMGVFGMFAGQRVSGLMIVRVELSTMSGCKVC